MSKPLPCGISIPQTFQVGGYDGTRAIVTDDPTDVDFLTRFVKTADSLAYDSLWVLEAIVGSFPFLEPLTLLGFVAALTERAKLGTSVLVTPLRNPLQLAKAIATLDHLSAGRIIAGIGIGAPVRPGSPAPEDTFGLPKEHRVQRFEEGIAVMKTLWTERPANFSGRFWNFGGAFLEPHPIQSPHPPIWFGARREPALRRAVLLGDGWMAAGGTSFPEFREQSAAIRSHLAQLERDEATFAISRRIYVAVDDDRERARRRLREFYGGRYGNPDLCDVSAAFGSPDDCLETLQQHAEAGANHLLLNPVFDEIEQATWLARDVVPKLMQAT